MHGGAVHLWQLALFLYIRDVISSRGLGNLNLGIDFHEPFKI